MNMLHGHRMQLTWLADFSRCFCSPNKTVLGLSKTTAVLHSDNVWLKRLKQKLFSILSRENCIS